MEYTTYLWLRLRPVISAPLVLWTLVTLQWLVVLQLVIPRRKLVDLVVLRHVPAPPSQWRMILIFVARRLRLTPLRWRLRPRPLRRCPLPTTTCCAPAAPAACSARPWRSASTATTAWRPRTRTTTSPATPRPAPRAHLGDRVAHASAVPGPRGPQACCQTSRLAARPPGRWPRRLSGGLPASVAGGLAAGSARPQSRGRDAAPADRWTAGAPVRRAPPETPIAMEAPARIRLSPLLLSGPMPGIALLTRTLSILILLSKFIACQSTSRIARMTRRLV